MALRTNEDDVRILIDNDADYEIAPMLEAANSLVDVVSSKDADSELSTALLRQIETWLAAHFYGIRDPQPINSSQGKASETFQGQTGMYLDSTFWGQQAILLDVTGYLSGLNQQAKVGGKRAISLMWMGTKKSSQTNYVDRD